MYSIIMIQNCRVIQGLYNSEHTEPKFELSIYWKHTTTFSPSQSGTSKPWLSAVSGQWTHDQQEREHPPPPNACGQFRRLSHH